MDDFIVKRPRRHVKDLNLIPIIDMLTTVVFFLLLSASFEGYTKLTVPPSSTVSVDTSSGPDTPAISPKLILVGESANEFELILSWGGADAGELTKKLGGGAAKQAELLKLSQELVGDFAKKFPGESSLQIGLEGNLPYQDLISMMDGARTTISNLVLISDEGATRN